MFHTYISERMAAHTVKKLFQHSCQAIVYYNELYAYDSTINYYSLTGCSTTAGMGMRH